MLDRISQVRGVNSGSERASTSSRSAFGIRAGEGTATGRATTKDDP